MKAILEGTITSFEVLGEVLKYDGTVLCPGTWQGIDRNKINYNLPVIAEGATTFSGVALHEGHQDLSRGAVKGFNASSWFSDGCIKNRGYIWDKETIQAILEKRYPMGQSMEAEVWVDEQMNALRIKGDSIAIGVQNPACANAKIGNVTSVRMSMEDDKRKAILEGATLIGEPTGKVVALSEDEYVQLKALAEKGKTADSIKADLEGVKTTLAEMKASKEASEISGVVSEIVLMDKEFKVEAYCEGVTEHPMRMRMLNAYRGILAKVSPILPGENKVAVKNEDLGGVAKEVFGADLSSMFLKKEGS